MTGLFTDHWSPRGLIAATWVVLFLVVLFAPAWLASAAVVGAFCWVAVREWRRAHHPSTRT
jgi:hypothetical protein